MTPDAKDLELLLERVQEGCTKAPGSGRPEATLREYVQPILSQILKNRGVRFAARDEVRLDVPAEDEATALDAPLAGQGRADAIYNRFVIEFEPPGSLRPSVMHSATRHAVDQVRQYLRGVQEATGVGLDHLAGCVFDGSWLVFVTWERGDWQVTVPRTVDTASLGTLVDVLESLATGRGLTADNLDEDFGRDSEMASLAIRALVDLLLGGWISPRAQSMLQQWHLDLGNASGPFSSSDISEWETLCNVWGVPAAEEVSRQVLFCLQTYFALVAKLVALVVLEGATGASLVKPLQDEDDVLAGFRLLESGELTAPTGAMNVIEPGVFSWYLEEKTEGLEVALRRLVEIASEYSAEIVDVSPRVAKDILKDLFQRLLPRSIRHRLGEYYTPDWLAHRLLDQVAGPRGLTFTTKVLDPACGSGTFLVEVISRMILNAGDEDPHVMLESIVRNVVGFDLSPLAVQASKVNYLLAIAPLFRHGRAPIFIPVFLADSVSPPRRTGLLEGDAYTLDTSEGEWRLPASLSEPASLQVLDSLFHKCLEKGSSRAEFEAEAGQTLPGLADSDSRVAAELGTLYEKLSELHNLGRNGMWWSLVANAFAPSLQEPFDYVVGNPPWVSWETLPERYRRANDDLWLQYRLRPSDPHERRQASQHVKLDLSMLFVARSIDRYLRDGGRLGFVITSTVFRSELAGRGFRLRYLPSESSEYSFVYIDEMSSIKVFEGAANQTAVLIAERRRPEKGPIPAAIWKGVESSVVPPDAELDRALRVTSQHELFAEPVNARDRGSPLAFMPEDALEITRPVRRQSPYIERIREGINTRGANGIFFVEVLETRDGLVRVRNVPAEGRNRQIPTLEGSVEPAVVKKLLRGVDVHAGSAVPVFGLLFFHDQDRLSHPLSEGVVKKRFPYAYEYMQNFAQILRSRSRFRNFDPSGHDWLGLYSVTKACIARHKVVIRDIARGTVAAPVHDEAAIADHTLNVIPCTSEDEAELLSAVINSNVVHYIARSFSVSIRVTASFLRYVGIKDLSTLEISDAVDPIALALGLSPQEYIRLNEVAERELPFL